MERAASMFRRCLLAFALLGFAGGSALAQTPFAFAGSVVITARAGADCNSVNVQVNELHTSVYRPVQEGVSKASLQLFQDQAAVRLVPSNTPGFTTSGPYVAQMFSGRGDLVGFTGNFSQLKIKPNPQTSTTAVIDISGKLTHFKSAANCTITFAGGYVLKPPPQH
jgi:hypothetical protein